jgi:hypothetical protein
MTSDPVQVDPRHYRVEFENDRVRVLRIRYGPHEKSVMHSHPPGVGVFLTDHHARFTGPDGKTWDWRARAGEFFSGDGTTHSPENLSEEPFELIEVELKS